MSRKNSYFFIISVLNSFHTAIKVPKQEVDKNDSLIQLEQEIKKGIIYLTSFVNLENNFFSQEGEKVKILYQRKLKTGKEICIGYILEMGHDPTRPALTFDPQ